MFEVEVEVGFWVGLNHFVAPLFDFFDFLEFLLGDVDGFFYFADCFKDAVILHVDDGDVIRADADSGHVVDFGFEEVLGSGELHQGNGVRGWGVGVLLVGVADGGDEDVDGFEQGLDLVADEVLLVVEVVLLLVEVLDVHGVHEVGEHQDGLVKVGPELGGNIPRECEDHDGQRHDQNEHDDLQFIEVADLRVCRQLLQQAQLVEHMRDYKYPFTVVLQVLVRHQQDRGLVPIRLQTEFFLAP